MTVSTLRSCPLFDSVQQVVLSLGVQRLGVAVRVQPLVLSLGAQRLGVVTSTSKVASLGDRCYPTIEDYSSSSARCDRSCDRMCVINFLIAFVIVHPGS